MTSLQFGKPFALAVAIAVAVSGCSGGQSGGGAQSTSLVPEISVSTMDQTANAYISTADEEKVFLPLDPGDLNTESSTGLPRYHVQWPSVRGSDRLTARLAETSTSWKTSYASSMQDADFASFSSSWAPTLNHDGIVGVRLYAEQQAADSAEESVTLYGDRDHQWDSVQLLSSEAAEKLESQIQEKVRQFTQDSDDLDMHSPSDGLFFQDLVFTQSGDLQIRLASGIAASISSGPLLISVRNPQTLLSEIGAKIMQAYRVQSHAVPAASAQASTTHPPLIHPVNCSIEKCLALTFDDGPGPFTSQILDTLEAKGAKATFFMLGPAAQAQPAILRRMDSLGMGLGDHSWTHPQFTKLSPAQVSREITSQADVVREATGKLPIGVRPPYGAFDRTTPHEGYPFILWDVDSEDWKNRDSVQTTQRVLQGAHPGSIVLMHDIHKSTAEALPGIIDKLQGDGYKLVSISELLPGMAPGSDYFTGAKG